MNINTLTTKELEHKDGTLPVALYPNNMAKNKNGKNSFYAMTIIRGRCDDKDIANDIVIAGMNGDLTLEQLLRAMELAKNARLARLADGYAVDDGINKSQLKVNGPFESESENYSSEKHSISISSHPTAEAKAVFSKIIPSIRQGNTIKPEITSVYDLKSKSGSVLTRGGYLEIKGANIKICGDSGEVALYFVNKDDSSKTVKLLVDDLGSNKASCLACVVPAELESGTYSIKIVTQFMGGKSFRKESQSVTYGVFAVE